MDKPATSQKGPYQIKVEKGKIYFWCACGLSQKQPFCDGTHKKEGKFKSVKFLAMESEELDFGGCKMWADHLFVTAQIRGLNSKL